MIRKIRRMLSALKYPDASHLRRPIGLAVAWQIISWFTFRYGLIWAYAALVETFFELLWITWIPRRTPWVDISWDFMKPRHLVRSSCNTSLAQHKSPTVCFMTVVSKAIVKRPFCFGVAPRCIWGADSHPAAPFIIVSRCLNQICNGLSQCACAHSPPPCCFLAKPAVLLFSCLWLSQVGKARWKHGAKSQQFWNRLPRCCLHCSAARMCVGRASFPFNSSHFSEFITFSASWGHISIH